MRVSQSFGTSCFLDRMKATPCPLLFSRPLNYPLRLYKFWLRISSVKPSNPLQPSLPSSSSVQKLRNGFLRL
ncbi:hypothetical protein ACFX14_008964 [Malus domestica]